MKIYTGFGDSGKTMLHGGEVVDKDHLRVEIYGSLDELNSWLGLIITTENDQEIKLWLEEVQNNIFNVSAIIATPPGKNEKKLLQNISDLKPDLLEKYIDSIDSRLDLLKNFILPGGTQLASYYHIARTVCRRSERLLISLHKVEKINVQITVFLNRLSDLLFVLARFANKQSNIEDVEWPAK